MHWLYDNLLHPFISVATISTAAWLVGQWLGFLSPEVTKRFRGISMAIMRAVIPPQKKWYKRGAVWLAASVALTAIILTVRKGRR